MRHVIERLGVLLGLVLTLTWPMLLGGVIAGREGMFFAVLIYAAFGALLLLLLLLGGIRGILGTGHGD